MIPERQEINELGLAITSAHHLEKDSQPLGTVMQRGDPKGNEVTFLSCGDASGSQGKQIW